jgi:hypothetical protein
VITGEVGDHGLWDKHVVHSFCAQPFLDEAWEKLMKSVGESNFKPNSMRAWISYPDVSQGTPDRWNEAMSTATKALTKDVTARLKLLIGRAPMEKKRLMNKAHNKDDEPKFGILSISKDHMVMHEGELWPWG